MSSSRATTAGTGQRNGCFERRRERHRTQAARRRMSLRILSSAAGAFASEMRGNRARAELLSAMSNRDTRTYDLLSVRSRRSRGRGINRILSMAGTAVLSVPIAVLVLSLCSLNLSELTLWEVPVSRVVAATVLPLALLYLGAQYGRVSARNGQRLAGISASRSCSDR